MADTTARTEAGQTKLRGLISHPLGVAVSEHLVPGVPVHAHLVDNVVLQGELAEFSSDSGMLRLKARGDSEPRTVAFEQLKYLEFVTPIVAERITHPVAEHSGKVVIPNKDTWYEITFHDGSLLRGQSLASRLDKSGLHLYPRLDDGRLRRLFVPFSAIKNYKLGPQLGKALLDQQRIDRATLNQAVDTQRALRNRNLVDYLRDRVITDSEKLQQVLDNPALYKNDPGITDDEKLGHYLVEKAIITPAQLAQALRQWQQDQKRRLGDILVAMGAVREEDVLLVMAAKLGVPFVKLKDFTIQPEAIDEVPEEIARRYNLLPLMLYSGRLVIAVNDPVNSETLDAVRFITGHNIEPVLATQHDIEKAIDRYYRGDEELLAAEEGFDAPASDDLDEAEIRESSRLGKEKPIVRLVNNFILDAIRRRASDIHIRPGPAKVELLYRIDGSLVPISHFSKGLLPAVVSRIKIMGHMNIAERRLPQDGRARVRDHGNKIDLRISVIPTVIGESVVIRLLNTEVGLKSIEELGFSEQDQGIFRDLVSRSYGIILVSGPTGSGKSTTLYAALQELIHRKLNIITVEDPVEYRIAGIEQIQVNTAPDYTFARALRHILRHDPDVIMIGEVRDEETAKIAIESALTGHLVLSTLHTNSAVASVTRLLEMGIEAYLVSSALLGVLAQRLVRRNCPHCLAQENIDPEIRKALDVSMDESFYKGAGCDECNWTGYHGRMAVYELLVVGDAFRALIKPGVTADELQAVAMAHGMMPLTRHALAVARDRKTSLEEVYRVRL
jgi:type IV pilus assembly protein PilB